MRGFMEQLGVSGVTGAYSKLCSAGLSGLLNRLNGGHATPEEVISMSATREAELIIYGDRENDYGKPEDSFAQIALYWNAYFKNAGLILARPLDEADISMLLMLLKLAREQGAKPKRDNLVDLIGYAALLADRLPYDAIMRARKETL